MGYSTLVKYEIWSDFHYGERTHEIDSVAIHCMAGNLSIQDCGALFQAASTRASSNYGIASNGDIGVFVDENYGAWCTSNRGVDGRAISIEVANTSNTEPFACTDEAYESLISLLVDICNRHNISGLKWKNDQSYAIAAANGGPVTEQNIFVHRWFANKSCPGTWLFERMGQIASEVNTRMTSGAETQSSNTSSTQTYTSTSLEFDYSEFNPYVVRLDRGSTDVPYTALKEKRVVGAIVEGGYRFNLKHQIVDRFENPKISDQIKHLNDANIPYGLYLISRARNSVEAKDEMYYMSFPIRRYAPKLGVWIELEVSTNNYILDRYLQDLTRLGYKGKIGFICSRDVLDKIDWANYQEDVYLYLVEHIEDTAELDKLLDPEFFDTDGEG